MGIIVWSVLRACKSEGASYILLLEHQVPMPKSALCNFIIALAILLLPLYNVNEVGHDGVAYVTVFLDIWKPKHSERSHKLGKTYLKVTYETY